MIDTELLLAALGIAATATTALTAIRFYSRAMKHGGEVNRTAWQSLATELGFDYTPDPLNPRMRGAFNDVTVQLAAKITRRRHYSRYGGRREVEYAYTEIRVPLRAAVPYGFRMQVKTGFSKFASTLFGGGGTARINDDIDEFFLTWTSDPETTREILDDLDVKKALLRLASTLPEAIIHERAITVSLPGMVTDNTYLQLYLDALTKVVLALRDIAPHVEAEVDEAGAAVEQPAMVSSALPPRRDTFTTALRRLSLTGRPTPVDLAQLKQYPMEFELEVRSVTEAVSRLGIGTGGRTVRGLISRSTWKGHITFDAECNEDIDELKMGDLITGMAEVDDVRHISLTVEATAVAAPVLLASADSAEG